MEKATSTQPATLRPYVLQFLGINVLCTIAIVVITSLLNFDVPSSMGIIALVASVAPTMQSFARKEARGPTKSERVSFATLGSIGATLLSVLPIAAMMAYYHLDVGTLLGLGQISGSIIALLLLISVLVSWLVIYFSSGFMAKQTLKQNARQKER